MTHQMTKLFSYIKMTMQFLTHASGMTRKRHNVSFVYELSCSGFRHSAGFHAKVNLDAAACRLGGLREVHDVLGVLGEQRVVPIVVRVLVSW